MKKEVDLCGKICPFPIMLIIKEVDNMAPGEEISFVIDDPLALKSVPEEMEDFSGYSHNITSRDNVWVINIKRES